MSKATLNQSQELLKLVSQSGIDRDQLQLLLESGRFSELLREFIEVALEPTSDAYTASVDYEQALADMIGAGRYDWTDDDITTEHFPVNKRESGEVELHVVHFGRNMTTCEVLAELDRRGLRPAELPELLALGAAHPDLQRWYPLAALGSEWGHPNGRVFVPILAGSDDRRFLDLDWDVPGYKWDDIFRFVAVSK